METEEEYFAKRDRDVLSGLGTIELEYISREISKRRDYNCNYKVLDIGCGSGMGMLRMKNEFLHLKNIAGIDTSKFAIKVAKKRGFNCNIDNAEKLETIKDNEFDFAYGLHLLEHTDPVKTMTQAIRVARKAVFIFPMGVSEKLNKKKLKIANENQKGLFHDFDFTEEYLLEVLAKVKYERHKIIKNVVTYVVNGIKYKNYMVILYRDKPSVSIKDIKIRKEGK